MCIKQESIQRIYRTASVIALYGCELEIDLIVILQTFLAHLNVFQTQGRVCLTYLYFD